MLYVLFKNYQNTNLCNKIGVMSDHWFFGKPQSRYCVYNFVIEKICPLIFVPITTSNSQITSLTQRQHENA